MCNNRENSPLVLPTPEVRVSPYAVEYGSLHCDFSVELSGKLVTGIAPNHIIPRCLFGQSPNEVVVLGYGGWLPFVWLERKLGTTTVHVIGSTCHYDDTNFVFVAKRRGRAAWQQTQNQWHNDKSVPVVTSISFPLDVLTNVWCDWVENDRFKVTVRVMITWNCPSVLV